MANDFCNLFIDAMFVRSPAPEGASATMVLMMMMMMVLMMMMMVVVAMMIIMIIRTMATAVWFFNKRNSTRNENTNINDILICTNYDKTPVLFI